MRRVVAWSGAGVVAAGVAAGVAWAAGGAAAAVNETQSSLVEDYALPGAEQVLAEHGVRVIAGDGNVELVESLTEGEGFCEWDLVEVRAMPEEDVELFCFKTSGRRGFLTMEIPAVFAIRTAGVDVAATAVVPGEAVPRVVKVERNDAQTVGFDAVADPSALLVELRFGDW